MDKRKDEGKAALYQRILSDIRDHIVSGEWPPGYRIPFEHELSAQYACSRITVNKAVSELARTGLIERRRHSGSFVSRPHSQAAILEIQDIRAEVEAMGLPYRYEFLSRRERTATRQDEKDTGFAAGDRLIELVCRHHAGAAPFCLEERTISLAAVPDAVEQDFQTTAPGAWLVGHVPWNAAEHKIRAVSASEQVAKMLNVPRNSACLVILRRTWSGDVPVTRVTLTYAGDTYSLVARFAPQNG